MNTESEAVAAAKRAMSLVCVSLPHLSGLAHAVRITADHRVRTAGVFASGRLILNPEWFAQFNDVERAFVLAHELLHLALRSHDRTGTDHVKFNIAHDLIINDMLETELGIHPPAGGLRRPGARQLSAEALMVEATSLPQGPEPDTALGAALTRAMRSRGETVPHPPEDVLDEALEREWFPDQTPAARANAIKTVHREVTKAVSLQRIQERAREAARETAERAYGTWSEERSSAYVDALAISCRPPWQLAMHRWLDAAFTPRRTYSRASRRGADRTDVALPGRSREAQILSIVLDTSGSMTDEIAHVLGSIMAFAQATEIESVRIVQCDTAVTSDELVAIEQLSRYRVEGFGGSDMSPAMLHLAADPETAAVVVITDGAIDYPEQPMPYDVLWVVYGVLHERGFAPRYGQVVQASTAAR